jgi:hypothetical protein
MQISARTMAFCSLLLFAAHRALAADDDFSWQWSDKSADVMYSVLQIPAGYTANVQVVADEKMSRKVTITIQDSKNHGFQWQGNAHSVFHIDAGSGRLYYAIFNPNTTGAQVECIDLATGKALWRSRLEGIAIRGASRYSNQLNMAFGENHVTIYGNESQGKYIETLDGDTGKQLRHQLIADPAKP